MKRIISFGVCLFMLINMVGSVALLGNATDTDPLFSDSFNYSEFSGGLYDGAWEVEYSSTATDDYGAYDATAPDVVGGAGVFSKGDALRFNWQKASGFSSFDANKTYTLSFEVTVTDFGNDEALPGHSVWNRELYFAPGGYYNQIEFRNANQSNQLGIRAGDKTDSYTKGGWTNDLSTYKKDVTYSCTLVWKPSGKSIVTTVKNGNTVVAEGIRTNDDYATLNKYTRSFVWRCEDGGFKLDNLTFTDGTNTYTQSFSSDGANSMAASGIWGVEDVRKTDATAPTLSSGVLKFTDKNSVRFNWQKVGGVGEYNLSNAYDFAFDVKITGKGDASTWSGAANTRALYVAFGGYYNVIELLTSSDTVKIGSTSESFTDSKYLNKTLRLAIRLQGSKISASISDTNGNVLLSGERNDTVFTDMTSQEAAMSYLVLRCEDGAVEVDNFSFNVVGNRPLDTKTLDIKENQQAIYECDLSFGGEGSVSVNLGGTELVYVSANEMKAGGKGVAKTFGVGKYKVKINVNPAQNMVSTLLTGPNGEAVQRGFFNLLGENSIYVFATEGNGASNFKLNYEDVNLNSYTITTTEPVYTGYNAKVYNVTTSFDNAQTTRNLAWTARADYIGSGSMAVKYRVKGTTSWNTVNAVKVDKLATTSESSQPYYVEEEYFKCDLTGLTADTTYEYKIGKKGSTDETNDWSQTYTFITAKEEINEFTFLAIGDTQGLTWDGTNTTTKGFMYTKVALDEAFEEVNNPAFILHTGDVVERGWRQDYWNYYFKSVAEYSPSTAMFTAIGNHDTQCNPDHHFYFDYHYNHPNNGGAAALDKNITSQITNYYALNTVNNPEELIYTFDYGDAHFIVLNTGSYTTDDELVIEAQRQWLIDDLKANVDAKWKIMLFHEPVYHRKGGSESRPWLNTVIEGLGVDLVIQGHSHLVTRTYPMKNGQIVTKTNPDNIHKGIGTVYTTVGSTTLNHDGAGDTEHIEEIYGMSTPIIDQPAYTYITVKGDTLEVTTKQIDGLVLDNFTISSENPVPPGLEDNGNLAQNKSYVASGIHSDNAYPDENGVTLTDGIASDSAAKYSDAGFVGFHSETDEYIRDGFASVTVDLGKKYNLNKLVARLSTETEENVAAGVKNIKKVEFFVSDDNKSWVKAGEAAPSLSDGNTNATLALSKAVGGRYVQYRFITDNKWIMVSEVEAYGEDYVEAPPVDDDENGEQGGENNDPKPDPNPDPDPTPDPDPNPDPEPTPDPEPDTEPEFMLGDVNDSKEIDSMDYVLVKRAYFGTFDFNEDQFARGDVNKSGDIDSMDYVLIKRAYFGTFTFN